ncbi:MAG: hypothetical protein RIE06_17970 [Roseibium album]|uniref:hypothetical protein n=1 Tax=Roseibium album TaxID=311410 RepID=UPI000A9EEBE5|nr:hypothetical protein [Labrenzia sp. EL_142]MBG6173763.1 hypothetical protein [Labrenzia sp. EL_132]MBG6228781.1 hypothetical protein [Labrenzia sp. EL_208]MCR9056582.1 hypothetical protein [Paracoccaceae bacterium]
MPAKIYRLAVEARMKKCIHSPKALFDLRATHDANILQTSRITEQKADRVALKRTLAAERSAKKRLVRRKSDR